MSTARVQVPAPAGAPIPLCVDLDGTLIHSDLLLEGLLRLVRHHPQELWRIPLWLRGGRARFKEEVVRRTGAPETAPPVHQALLDYLGEQHAAGRPVHLVTASHEDALGPVRDLFPFAGIIASNGGLNLKGEAKARVLVERFGEKGFDYAGDSHADEAVWDHARRAITVNHSTRRLDELARKYDVDRSFCTNMTGWRDWLRGIRVHQWSKNLLIALPFLAGHHFHTVWQLAGLLAAFLAMSLCASGTYLWNDLLDLDHDRAHPRKRRRLAASGKTSIQRVLLGSLALAGGGLLGGFLLAPGFGLMLLGYMALTLSYSLLLKRVVLVDIFALAFLYLSRIVAGIIISEAVVSFWLFAFTFLIFLSLAAAKRHVELQHTAARGDDSLGGRGYRTVDLPAVSALGIATGVASCIVLGLYSNSPQVVDLYTRPEWFWGICVIALFWISRIWLLTHRDEMHDDPVVFALRDGGTWIVVLLGLACVLLAAPVPNPPHP